MAVVPPIFLNTVVAIGDPSTGSPPTWIATGFLYGQLSDSTVDPHMYRIYLVTNRHVAEPLRPLVMRLNPSDGSAAHSLSLDPTIASTGQPLWFFHPDPEVDIAVTMITGERLKSEGFVFNFFESDFHSQTLTEMSQAGRSVGDGIFLLGFPGVIDVGIRSLVIVRAGCLARIDDAFSGHSKSFLIDVNNFPGNSGGPVVTKVESTFIEGTPPVLKSHLIGIVASYIYHSRPAAGVLPGQPPPIFQENTGLAIVFPVDAIRAAIAVCENLVNP